MQISNQELEALVRRLSLSRFEKPFSHTVRFNSRLRTTGGRVVFPRIGRKVIDSKIYMEINPKLEDADLEGVILHELSHYHLYFIKGLHREDDPDFRTMLKNLEAPLHSPLHRKQRSFYVYVCTAPEHHQYSRNRRIDVKKMRCGFDGATLRLISEYHV
ncbi:MAG: SprT family protein [Lactobacillaceae bacterium]|jgi:SprT-like protein|nr:SprT family protein [Lactobacillaceae bacterium]